MQEKLIDKLIEECTENVEEAKLAKITSMQLHSTENENMHKCSQCVVFNNRSNQHWNLYLFFYYKYMNCNKESVSKYNYVYQTTHY